MTKPVQSIKAIKGKTLSRGAQYTPESQRRFGGLKPKTKKPFVGLAWLQ